MSQSRTDSGNAPSLSFEKQPALRQLMTLLVDTSDPVTIFCGAGTSVDSGLPTWVNLLRTLAEEISHDGTRALILNEPDIKRSAAFILNELRNALGDRHKVAQALYRNASGNGTPGPLAASIAQFARQLGPSRVKILTTNYDDRLELALRAEYGGDDAGYTVFGLSDHAAWNAESKTIPILHLHGFLPSIALDHVGDRSPLILTEGEYLQYGSQVQEIVHNSALSSTMIFVGASMADTSVVYPLSSNYSTLNKRRPFALLAPDISAASRLTQSRVESLAAQQLGRVADYIENTLGAGAITLKSYAQVSQCVGEMSAALESKRRYLVNDPQTSARYGFRFQRVMREIHARLGVKAGEFAPDGRTSSELSDRLEMAYRLDGGPASLLESRQKNLDYEQLGVDESYFDDEQWSLNLWLRSVRAAPKQPRYMVFQAGSSAFSRRRSLALDERATVSPRSHHAAARCVFAGVSVAMSVDPDLAARSAQERAWLTFLAVPLVVSESDLGLPATTRQRVTVGAIVMQSSRWRAEEMRPKAHELPASSLLSGASLEFQQDLSAAIHQAGVRVITA